MCFRIRINDIPAKTVPLPLHMLDYVDLPDVSEVNLTHIHSKIHTPLVCIITHRSILMEINLPINGVPVR